MATVLMPVLYKIAEQVPRAALCTFADDRTAAARSQEEIDSIESIWRDLERVTALRTNDAKTQNLVFDATTRLPNASVKVLGVRLDAGVERRHATTPEDETRAEECKRRAARVRALPLQ
eukprot:9477190-Pyramimonas_sp.AAC.1